MKTATERKQKPCKDCRTLGPLCLDHGTRRRDWQTRWGTRAYDWQTRWGVK